MKAQMRLVEFIMRQMNSCVPLMNTTVPAEKTSDRALQDGLVARLLSAIGSARYERSSMAAVPVARDGLSPQALKVYETMVGAYVKWAVSCDVDVLRDPAAAVNGFIAFKASEWSDGTRRRYERLLTRMHQAHSGGALIVLAGSTSAPAPPRPRPPRAGAGEVDLELAAGESTWLSRQAATLLTSPLFALLPEGVQAALNALPEQREVGDIPGDEPQDWKLARNIVMLSMGLDLGVRFQEIRRLRIGSLIDEGGARVTVHQDETVRTARARRLALNYQPPTARGLAILRAQLLLRWWVQVMPEALRGPGRLIFPSTGTGKPLTASTVYKILEALGQRTEVPKHWLFTGGIQALRRAHIHMALKEGVLPAELAAHLGVYHTEAIERYLLERDGAPVGVGDRPA